MSSLNFTRDNRDIAEAVNRNFNRSITYDVAVSWKRVQAGEDERGNCTVSATSKLDYLKTVLGWPLDALHIGECCVPPSVTRNHAVLLIQDVSGALYVASNGIDEIMQIDHLPWTQWGWIDHDTGIIDDFTFPGEQ